MAARNNFLGTLLLCLLGRLQGIRLTQLVAHLQVIKGNEVMNLIKMPYYEHVDVK